MVEHLVVASYRDPQIRDRLTVLYQRFAGIIRASLVIARPDLSPAQAQAISYAIVALAHSSPTLAWLRLDHGVGPALRAAAHVLVTRP